MAAEEKPDEIPIPPEIGPSEIDPDDGWLEARGDALAFEPIEHRRTRTGAGGRSVTILLAVIIVLAGGTAWFVWGDALFGGKKTEIPLIKAVAGPIKLRPKTPGGLAVPNRDKLVYDRLEKQPPAPRTETLLPTPERPLPAIADKVPTKVEPALERAIAEALAEAKRQTAPPPAPAPKAVQPAAPAPPPLAPPQATPQAPTAPPPPAPPAAELRTPSPEEVMAAQKPPLVVPERSQPKTVKSALVSLDKSFLIQLAALRSEDAARQEWLRLTTKNRDLLGDLRLALVRVDLGAKGIFFRLRAGPLKDMAAARALCKSLAGRKVGCLVIRPGG